MTAWMLAGHVQPEYRILPDQRTIDAVLRLDVESPIEEFSSRLSDILHNFRGGLDGLAWELAHENGAVPARPKQVYFPAESNPDRWPNLAKGLHSMSPAVLDRIEQSQPFHQPRPDLDVLAVLASLSNSDKHHDLISANLAPSFVANIGLKLVPGGSPDPNQSDVKFDFPEAPALEDGAVQIRMTAGRPVEYSTTSALSLSGLEWQVTDGSFGRLSLEALVNALALELPLIMRFVRMGGTQVQRRGLPAHTSGMSGTLRFFSRPIIES